MSTAPLLTPTVQKTRPLHVVMVDEEMPYPPTSGKRIRTLGLTERLARRHRLTYVCHRSWDRKEGELAAEHFARLGIRTVVVERPVRAKSGPGFYLRLAANLLSPLPYTVTSHVSPDLVDAVHRVAAEGPVDLWHCEWSPYAEAVRRVAGPRLVMAHNVESVIWRRYAETEPNPLKRWYIRRQWLKFRRFERTRLAEADLTVAVSDLDAERFQMEMGVSNVEVVDNGVDTAYFTPSDLPREGATLLFLGSLEWRPNLDAVAQLLDSVFPAVRRHEPGARLLLVGRNPPDWLRRRAAQEGHVELHGNVPDVRPFLARAGMLVVPLRVGGGSRLKILEALATATPVISTRVGAEGLHLEPGRHLEVTETPAEMTDVIVGAIRDPGRVRRQAEAGRRQVLRLYDWDVLADRLERLWLRCAAGRRQGGLCA